MNVFKIQSEDDDEEKLVPWDDENEQAVSFRIPKEVA